MQETPRPAELGSASLPPNLRALPVAELKRNRLLRIRRRSQFHTSPYRCTQRILSGHDHFRTPPFTSLRIKNPIGVLFHALSFEKWTSGGIHKPILTGSLLCHRSSSVCGAPCSCIYSHAQTGLRRKSSRSSIHWPRLTHRIEIRPEWKFGSWRRIFLRGSLIRNAYLDVA